jgi:LacI family transcriptional regulator
MADLATAPRRVTISDVAREAECSNGVVSAVVNNARGNITVSDATRNRVLAAAQRLGYRPNFASQSLARRSTQTIGIYLPPQTGASLGYSYEGRILRGVEQACGEHDYDLLVMNLGGAVTPEQCLARFREGRVEGLLLLHVPHHATWVQQLADLNLNVVAVNYYGGVARLADLQFDDRAATALAVKYLAGLGHRRIGYLGAVSSDLGPGGARRFQGYHETMAGLGLAVHPDWCWDHHSARFAATVPTGWSPQEGARGMDHLLSLGEARPTAVVCHDDLIAVAAIQRLAELGHAVPGTCSIVGIDDSDIAPRIFPRLTSVRQPLEEMGCRAATLLIQRAERQGCRPPVVVPPEEEPREPRRYAPELVVRESTATCRQVTP